MSDALVSSPAKLLLPPPLLLLLTMPLLMLPWPVQVPTSFSGGPQPTLTQQQQQWQPQHSQQHPNQAPALQVHGAQGLHGSQLQGSTESASTPGQVRCGVFGGGEDRPAGGGNGCGGQLVWGNNGA